MAKRGLPAYWLLAVLLLLSTGGLDVSAAAAARSIPLTVTTARGRAHILLSPDRYARDAAALATGTLTYHGGPIMQTSNAYLIFWEPPTLQDGTPTSVPSNYNSLIKRYFKDVGGHSLYTILTQYYQCCNAYIHNTAKVPTGAVYVDTSPYPTGQCSGWNPVTGANCITWGAAEQEIQKVMTLNGWTAGMDKEFFVYTTRGESICMGPNNCSYQQFCAFHSSFQWNGANVIHAVMPYAGTGYCDVGQPRPNNSDADVAISISAHEQFESITDPLLNAWYDTNLGGEIADKCYPAFGTNTWDNGLANQSWEGHFYEVQEMWDNHASSIGQSGCQQVGPL